MMVDIKDLMSQVTMIRLKSESLAAEARVLEQTLRNAVAAALPAEEMASNAVACACPPNRRVAASTLEHPQRTKCGKCNKEHD